MDRKGITIVSPMYGELSTTNRMIFSVIHQFISSENPFNIHLVLIDDYIEKRGENDESIYEYYISDEFEKFYDTRKIKIDLIKNQTHKYQGESREIGFMAGEYDWFLMIDCDDMLAPNACDRYMNVINEYYKDHPSGLLACTYGLVYGFDTNGYEQKIVGESIWVQSRCFNREFIKKHGIHFPTGLYSKYGEDCNFMRKFDYALAHDNEYEGVKIPYNENEDCQCTAYWFPNKNSLSRKDSHYAQHLSGWTMGNTLDTLSYFESFNRLNEIDNEEELKTEWLNACVYSWFNLLDFLKEVATTDYIPDEADWHVLKIKALVIRNLFRVKYYNKCKQSEIEDMLYKVRHFTDCRVTESWLGTFDDYVNDRDTYRYILEMPCKAMIRYCHKLIL